MSSSRKHIVSSFTLKSRTEPEKHQRAVISHINSPGHATRTNQRLDEIGNSNVAIRAEKLLKSWQKASPANGQCGPGHANRDGFPCFPLSLSLEPNGHIGASCHCHPRSIHSGLAPSSQLSETHTPLRFGCAQRVSQKALDHLPHTRPMVCRMSRYWYAWTLCG